ncbi:MAG: hypothetical protein HWN69_07090 [Desulfobacterales bacterium]|nr:hypothetical protein [Desulfobacterales bacterium]
MAKIRTEEDDFAIGSEWTNWDYNSRHGYYNGIIHTSNGLIKLYYQPKTTGYKFMAIAKLAYNGRIYSLKIEDEVTRLGWVRIVKKWARKIWSQ